MAFHIEEIIQRMGYAESSCLFKRGGGFAMSTFSNTDPNAKVSAHTVKVLNELAPYAVFMVDDEPFVLFFEEIADHEMQRQISRKVWNAQVPVAIVCESGKVSVYNGRNINKKREVFQEVFSKPLAEIDQDSPFSYWEITSQHFWIIHDKHFKGDKLSDCLLRNLLDITNKLKGEEYNFPFATKLILRLIFIRYLIDRGVDLGYDGFSTDVISSRNALLILLQDKEKLYKLFSHLKSRFNGNLFEFTTEIEDNHLSPLAMQLLSDFLSANIDTQTGQLSFFDMYDFNIIPVELISNIYEILLGKEKQQESNAFYTPQYLVNYILDGSVFSFIRDNGLCTVLDPSCGSGIFLVESYRRMVENRLANKPFADTDEDKAFLYDVLNNCIYGVDLEEPAIDVAIFSLYLAALDYINPKILKDFRLPDLKGKRLFANNYFDIDRLRVLEDVSFDFIVGNPPWGQGDQHLAAYCKDRGFQNLLFDRDTCTGFILRTKDFCGAATKCCFVLHSKLLYRQGDKASIAFREFLLENTEIDQIVELSSVRKLIFKSATAPAMIFTFRFSDDSSLDNYFKFVSMKPNVFFRLFNIIVIERPDLKYVQQRVLKENDRLWKLLVYGLSEDIDIMSRLERTLPTVEDVINAQTPPLLRGVGVKFNSNKESVNHMDATALCNMQLPLFETKSFDHFTIKSSSPPLFRRKKVERIRDGRLFSAPYCLTKHGIDTWKYTMRSVFSDQDFIFKESIHAIKGTPEQRQLLLNITGLFNSSTFAYFNLMLGSDLGIEREERQMNEILRFPFAYDDAIAEKVEQIQATNLAANIDELNAMILSMYGIDNSESVDYALRIQIPQLTGKHDKDVYRPVTPEDFDVYGRYFYDRLTEIFSSASDHVTILAYPRATKYYSAFEVIIQAEEPKEWLQIVDSQDNRFAMQAGFSSRRINDLFYSLKDVLYFEENSFFILKPNFYKNWHPAIARIDLIDVVDQILSRDGRGAE